MCSAQSEDYWRLATTDPILGPLFEAGIVSDPRNGSDDRPVGGREKGASNVDDEDTDETEAERRERLQDEDDERRFSAWHEERNWR